MEAFKVIRQTYTELIKPKTQSMSYLAKVAHEEMGVAKSSALELISELQYGFLEYHFGQARKKAEYMNAISRLMAMFGISADHEVHDALRTFNTHYPLTPLDEVKPIEQIIEEYEAQQ